MTNPQLPDEIDRARSRFTSLLVANPNHFGNLEDSIFKAVEDKKSDTGYEEIGCVAYSPERDRLEATIVIKRTSGYSGGPCSLGSLEHVRFFVQYGSDPWIDAGVAAARVHDLPLDKDCEGSPDHPFVHVVGVAHRPLRKYCATPVLPRVRAILSWQNEPPAGDPNHVPVWGEVQEASVQIKPRRRFRFEDIVDVFAPLQIDPKKLSQLIEELDFSIPVPPEPDPIGPVALNPQPLPPHPDEAHVSVPWGLTKALRAYDPKKLKILSEKAVDDEVAKLVLEPPPAHRLAALEVTQALTGVSGAAGIAETAQNFTKVDLDWSKIVEILQEGKGDTSFEELECLGLDNAAGQLVATYRVKRPTGFSGPPCGAGSTEYVAFWADWGDECEWSYVGTVPVAAHDYVTMPRGGLSYAAVLPVDLGAVRRNCDRPGLHRVRAVLSWNTPPSTVDPDAVPHWGNRVDTHVHVLPGVPYDGHARMTIVGGVPVTEIDPTTGVTEAIAHIAYTGSLLDSRGCPFAGLVTVHGPADPTLAGSTYRLQSRNVTAGGSFSPVITPFFVVDSGGVGSWVTPNPADGTAPWPIWNVNTLGTLGYVTPSGDDLWEIRLEVGPGFVPVQVQRVQLDNTLNGPSADPLNSAHLAIDPGQLSMQACGKFTQGMVVTGTFDAHDQWFGSWSLGLSPSGGVTVPTGALTTVPTTTSLPAPVGSTWQLDTSGLTPCGYVLRLSVSDRAIVNSTYTGRSVPVEIGFCVDSAT
jgi:hypothetical protein